WTHRCPLQQRQGRTAVEMEMEEEEEEEESEKSEKSERLKGWCTQRLEQKKKRLDGREEVGMKGRPC
ncbi:hypothetical protein NHX12_027151, partial [Muraenolepis orangiensis]